MSCFASSFSQTGGNNPLLQEWKPPFGVPPFNEIKNEHFAPAFEEAIRQQKAEIEAITKNPAQPTFENTIVAFDQSGDLLSKISPVFGGLTGANTNAELQKISKELTPIFAASRNEILFNQALFERIKYVYDHRNTMNLDKEQLRVVQKIYDDFARNGVVLPQEKQDELKKLNERMSMISLQLGQNLLAENNDYKLIIDKKADLAGLPNDVVAAAAEKAQAAGMQGKWMFDLSKPSFIPFLQYSQRRDLREKIYKAYIARGNNDNANDNKQLFAELMQLRKRSSEILGYKNYGEYNTSNQMAQNPQNVFDFLKAVWSPAIERAKKERDEMQQIANKEGAKFKLEAWDWWYYAEKVRKNKYSLNEDEIKPYLTWDNVLNGIFYVSNKLYGLTFKQRTDLPVYHNEVKTYEVFDKDGSHLSILYIDPYPRDSKRGGAWCSTFRSGKYRDGKKITPIVTIVTNFSRPIGDKPAMLNWDETETFFHEFGHALHNFFADGHYDRTSRDVPRDYVELPSQVMENWAGEPEVLKAYAKHYVTGKPMPDALIQKMQNSSKFNQGFINAEYIAAAYLDLKWHTTDFGEKIDVNDFERNTLKELGLIDEIAPRYTTTNFNHIFSGGYAAGYYVYLWAAQLDADAFEAFKESGNLFNQDLAQKFRKYCLSENAMGDGMEQYTKFRGSAPTIQPLLRQRGLAN